MQGEIDNKMKKIIIPLLIIGALFLMYMNFFSTNKEISILVFSKTAGFRHASIPDGIKAIQIMSKKNGWQVDATEDASVFNESSLQQYNVIIFLSTTGDILDDAQQLEMTRWIQAGGGFVGIHAATDTEYEWPWYNDLAGAYFTSHPKIQEAVIDRVDSTFIATKHLPERWKRTDEWYNFKSIKSHISVLLNLDESSYEGGKNGENHPVAWYHAFDGGRSFYTALGHTSESFIEPLFLEHLKGGIEYAANSGESR